MNKKINSYRLSVLSCLIMSPGLYAGTLSEASRYPDGWAWIAGAGETEFMNTGSYALAANNLIKRQSTKSFQFGFMGDLAIGYGKQISHPFYLGSELGVIFFGNSKTSSSSTTSNLTVVTQTNPADPAINRVITIDQTLSNTVTVSGHVIVPYFDLKPGLLISDNSFLFGRIGVDYNQIKVRTQSNYSLNNARLNDDGDTFTHNTSAGFSTKSTKQLAGLRTGLGFEYLLTENLGLSANYIYAFYSSFNKSKTASIDQVACDIAEGCVLNSDGTYLATGRSKMSDQQVLLELNYHLA
jgi:hypothetical protein